MNRLQSVFIVFGLTLIQACSQEQSTDSKVVPQDSLVSAGTTESHKAGNWRQHLTQPLLMTFEADTDYYWNLTTNLGEMRFRLFHATAPMHVTSTIYLTEQGFYDDLIFHRVIPGFMAQGGDPAGNGSGNPGYQYAGEFDGNLSHDRPGLLSMANAGPGTDGSQFFITFVATPFLDGKHTLFGELVSGMDTLRKLEAQGSRNGPPLTKLEIIKAVIQKAPASKSSALPSGQT